MSDRLHRITHRSVVDAPGDLVWQRVTEAAGINDELMPYLRMVFPRRYRGMSIADLPTGRRVGRIPLLYGGILPLDYDDLTLESVTPGTAFSERSTMASMAVWHHDRTLTGVAGGTEVRDELAFRARLLLRPFTPLLVRLIRYLFAHRHRRLAAYFSRAD